MVYTTDMSKGYFKHPKDMVQDKEKTPVSARITVPTKKLLEKAAKKHNLSLSSLISNILEDYGEWLSSNKK